MKKSKHRQKMDSVFSKYRSMIFVAVASIILFAIFLFAGIYFTRYMFDHAKTLAICELCLYVLFFNLGFITTYRMSKQLIIYNLLSMVVLMTWAVLAVFLVNGPFTGKILFVAGCFASTFVLAIGTYFAFRRSKEIYRYLGYQETLYDLTKRNFLMNGEVVQLRLFLKEGHFYCEFNGVRRKFAANHITNLSYCSATIYGRRGQIAFDIDELHFSYSYSSAFEDGIMFSLAYNIARINNKATISRKENNQHESKEKR